MGKFSRIFNHISKEDLKRVHEQKVRVQKLESERIEEERKEIKAEFEQLKSDWRKELKEAPTFQAVPIPGAKMTSSQVFAIHGLTSTNPRVVGSAIGNVTVTVDGGLGRDGTGVPDDQGTPDFKGIFRYPVGEGPFAGSFVQAVNFYDNNGEFGPVGARLGTAQIDFTDFALAGNPMPLGGERSRQLNQKKASQINKELDSSEKFTKKINADEFMKARVEDYFEKQKADEKFLNKQQTLVNLTKGFEKIGLPNDFAQWTLNYARGNLTPITKFSKSMTNQVRDLVLDKFAASPSGTKTVDIQYHDYGDNPFSKISTKLGLGRFNATKLPNGDIKITDTFNVDKTATHIGSARMIPGLQNTANRLVRIAHERRGITGNYDEGGIPINVVIKNSGRFAANAPWNKDRRSIRGKYYSGLK